MRAFYAQFPPGAVVGVEASGYCCGSIAPWRSRPSTAGWRRAGDTQFAAAGRKTTAVIPIWCSTCFAAGFRIHIPSRSATFARCAIVTVVRIRTCCATACRPSLSAIACVSVPDCSPQRAKRFALALDGAFAFSDSTPCFCSFPGQQIQASKTNRTARAKRSSSPPAHAPRHRPPLSRRDPCARSRHAFDRARRVAAYATSILANTPATTPSARHISKQATACSLSLIEPLTTPSATTTISPFLLHLHSQEFFRCHRPVTRNPPLPHAREMIRTFPAINPLPKPPPSLPSDPPLHPPHTHLLIPPLNNNIHPSPILSFTKNNPNPPSKHLIQLPLSTFTTASPYLCAKNQNPKKKSGQASSASQRYTPFTVFSMLLCSNVHFFL